MKETWRPKPEAALSAYITQQLRLRLADRDVVVNREVLVRPTDAYGAGERTDITVDALIHDSHATSEDRVAVVIEVKGAWNRDLLTAQRDQLAVRYLLETNTKVGIYLVGWYPIELWTADERRKTEARKHDRDDLPRVLREQADAISQGLGVRTSPRILDIPRPHNTTR